MVAFRRTPRFPSALLAEAARQPNGYVYEIDERFDPDGAIPAHAVRRGWKVGADGRPTGEFTDNPEFGTRRPLKSVEQVLADAKANSGRLQLDVFVADSLTVGEQPVSFDVGIAVVVDAVLGLGYEPEPDDWRSRHEGGWRFRWRRLDRSTNSG